MKKPFVLTALVMIGLVAFGIVTAQEYKNPIQAADIQGIISAIISFAQSIVKPLAVLAVLYAAFLYVTAGGNEKTVSQAHRALFYGVIGLAVVFSAEFIKAALAGIVGQAATQTLVQFANNLARLFGFFIIAASVIAILYSAFLFLTSGGDSGKVTTARQALLYAIIGIIVAVFAFVLPNIIQQAVPAVPPTP